MSDALAKTLRKRPPERGPALAKEELGALRKLRQEARAAGAKLQSDGKGGLPPSLVLHVMRRDGYRCVSCGGQDALGVHHKAGVVVNRWAARTGHSNDPGNINTLCAACHDDLHQGAKAAGLDSSQILPEGDLGTKRDRGQASVAGADGNLHRR